VSAHAQALLANAMPLLVLALVYIAISATLTPPLWRERRWVQPLDWAIAAVFPGLAACGLLLGALVVHDRRPLGGHLWISLAAILLALVPGLAFLVRWGERARVVGGEVRAREAEERVSLRDRELAAVAAIANALVRAPDATTIGRVVADEVSLLLGVEFCGIALVDADADRADLLVARRDGQDIDWWSGQHVSLSEPSGIASAVFDGAAVQVYDVASSTRVSRRLADAVGAKSGLWIPMVAEDRVTGVLVAASVAAHRTFTTEELDVLQAIVSEAGLALDRRRSADALADALERERLVAEISRKVRSELDVEAVMRVAVTEVARALAATRCFIRLEEDDDFRVVAEWLAEGAPPLSSPDQLPASNLAVHDRKTVAIADIATAAELDDAGRAGLAALGTAAALAVPIVVFDRLIGVVAIHCDEPRPWQEREIALVEAVAREIGLALQTTRLLDENRRRLAQQAALLHAAQVLTSELDLETVLERLVLEVTRLLDADAADCYLHDARRGVLRCAAVHGFDDDELIGFEFPADAGLAGRAIAEGRPVGSEDYEHMEQRVPSPAYSGFAGALVAPIAWGEKVRGVLGVGVRAPERRFTSDDADILGTLAGLAALAIRNAESFEERTRQAQIQQGFYRIAEVLGEPLSLAQTVAAIAQAAAQALGATGAAVLMPTSGELRLAGAHELPPALEGTLAEAVRRPTDAIGAAAADRRVLASSRIADDDRFDERWHAAAEAAGVRSLLAIPIEAPRGEAAAVAIVLFGEEHPFADDDLELARQVARAARGALERAELFDAERSARSLAQQLARTGSLLATELDPAAVLDEVVEQAAALLDAEAASIRSLEHDELVVAAGVGDVGETTLGVRTPSTAWPAGDVVHARAPVAVADVGRSGRPSDGDPVLAEGFSAYLGVPLYGREGALHGVLAVYAVEPRTWREEELEALTALAANASVALSNAELYQSVALERELSVTILANIADGIVAVDRDGRIVLWNAAAAQITGVPPDEAIGRTPEQVLQRDLESADGAAGTARLVSIVRGGEEIWLSLSEAVMRDPVGAVAGRIFAFRDISAERVVEEMKSDFVSTVSHELRTPLTSIYGFAETLLREDVAFGEIERRTFLGYIASESERLTSIVDALLNVARLDTGDLQVQIAPTDVAAVVADAVQAARTAGDGDGHSFVLELEDDGLTADADADKLRQILDQLIQNAVKFSPDGGAVTVSARRRSDAVEVSVLDEGVGIPAAEQQRIFTKFYRADAQRSGGGGAGLGLFIAQGLVTAMGGRIWVDSSEGKGSAFTFELPTVQEGE
jgi:PAS domain S-box-containing protein